LVDAQKTNQGTKYSKKKYLYLFLQNLIKIYHNVIVAGTILYILKAKTMPNLEQSISLLFSRTNKSYLNFITW